MKPVMYTTNETGFFRPKELFFSGEKMDYGCTVTARKTPANESFGGFGVALTGSSCYVLSAMPQQVCDSFLEDIYGEAGLGLSVGRVSVGSSDYSPSVYSYCDKKDDIHLDSFSVEQDQAFVLPMVKEVIRHNPNIQLFASPWSPPGWMKTSGNLYYGYMRDAYIDCYADYFIKFIKAYQAQGIPIYAVTPQNEPETQQGGRSVACLWHPDTESKFVRTLYAKLRENHLNTEIWLYDHDFSGWARVRDQLRHSPELAKACQAVAFHYYQGDPKMVENIRKEFPQMHWHFTEGGPRLYDHYDTDWCKWAYTMSAALSYGCDTFTGWNLLLDERGGPNVGPFSCGGLATFDSQSGALSYSGQYRAFKHFSALIKRGAAIYPLEIENKVDNCTFAFHKTTNKLDGVFAANRDGTEVLQLTNLCGEKVQAQFFHDEKWWYIELLPNTVASVVFRKEIE